MEWKKSKTTFCSDQITSLPIISILSVPSTAVLTPPVTELAATNLASFWLIREESIFCYLGYQAEGLSALWTMKSASETRAEKKSG